VNFPGAVWFDPCIRQSQLLIIDADCDDHELSFLTGFLKSRVYAKLLTRLISEYYQTFNRQVEEVEPGTA
jgi:hypothetical protein